MTELYIHRVVKIATRCSVFSNNSLVVRTFIITQEDGQTTEVNCFMNESCEIETLPPLKEPK